MNPGFFFKKGEITKIAPQDVIKSPIMADCALRLDFRTKLFF